ncbi:MAG: response regulator [Calditrichaeota bacterium]|nr:response regulator [Calditrichota bacterium]MCB0289275.1 response regulator [Calditrichota bacterium]MCB0303083.1 response regulator [Calditrichota bacterium]MCB0312816.1 response regulator [Calditrichota bacterium]MCB9088382.1 response regulator [Calditrichia bacterium]
MGNVKRLLIVDDEETLTFSLYQTFITAPVECEVVTASSGEEALTRLEQGPFDLVITDISMPGMDGLTLLRYIKAESARTQVIVITAFGSQEKEDEAYQSGADFYLEKPFDIREIKRLVINMLE